ncbi:hypothetical protein MHU86_7269 [Fragilaria crotonensis]|nr:hypothetical protein MHU86_7269 [Fragilaria crotonensis]
MACSRMTCDAASCIVDPLDDFWELVLDDDEDDVRSKRGWFSSKKQPQDDPVNYIIPEAVEVSLERAMDSVFLPPPPPKRPSLFNWSKIHDDFHLPKWKPPPACGYPRWFSSNSMSDLSTSPQERNDSHQPRRGSRRQILE